MMATLYSSDLHISHRNIILYARRPFASVEEMDAVLVANQREAEATGAFLVNCGDLSLNLEWYLKQHGPIFASPENKLFVVGNHDRARGKKRTAYESQFATVVGDESTWDRHGAVVEDVLDGESVTVLVSHKPQDVLWGGAQVNVYGHVHEGPVYPDQTHHAEDHWAFASPVHFCACVELHDFKPVTLHQLADAHRSGYAAAREYLRKDVVAV